MTTPRVEVYAAINSERDYQDKVWRENNPYKPEAAGDGVARPLSIGEDILLIERYVALAREAWATGKRPETGALHNLRKIAGIAVRCMETHGAPHR